LHSRQSSPAEGRALADTLADAEKANDTKNAVVAVDLDPQASLSHALLLRPNTPPEQAHLARPADGNTLASAIQKRIAGDMRSASDYLTVGVGPTDPGYALLANEAMGWDVERRGLRKLGEGRLQELLFGLLDDLANSYRYVLIDCPPGQTVLAEAAIRRSDLLLCPTTPEWLSYWGLNSFDEYLQELFEGSTLKPPARFVVTKFKLRRTRRDPQDAIIQFMRDFKPSTNYIRLLMEAGENSRIGGDPIKLPYDTRIAERLLGAPNPRRVWPWERIYTADTKDALRRLSSAIQKELKDGRQTGAAPRNGAPDRAERDPARDHPQDARQSRRGSTLTLPVTAAQTLPPAKRAELEIVVRDYLSQKEAEKLAIFWEPDRKLDADTKRTLKDDLADLLHGNRQVYALPKSMGLDEAREFAGEDRKVLRRAIERLAPLPDLKALLKEWDKHLLPKPTTRDANVDRLLALLDGAEPTPKSTRSTRPRRQQAA
jgi:cellulose biosynthesis protein BcsQ